MVLSVTQMNSWYYSVLHILFYYYYFFLGGGVLFYSKWVNSFIHNTL